MGVGANRGQWVQLRHSIRGGNDPPAMNAPFMGLVIAVVAICPLLCILIVWQVAIGSLVRTQNILCQRNTISVLIRDNGISPLFWIQVQVYLSWEDILRCRRCGFEIDDPRVSVTIMEINVFSSVVRPTGKQDFLWPGREYEELRGLLTLNGSFAPPYIAWVLFSDCKWPAYNTKSNWWSSW